MNTSTESSASSAGYKYQDLLALEQIVYLLDNSKELRKIVIDKSNIPHIEDIVIEYQTKKYKFIQAKHSNKDGNFTKSDLFSKEKSLFSKTFIGWRDVKKQKFDFKVKILTNKLISTQKRDGSSMSDIVNEIKKFQSTQQIDNNILALMEKDLIDNNIANITEQEIKNFLKDLYFTTSYLDIDKLIEKIKEDLRSLIQINNIDFHFNKLYGSISINATKDNERDRTFDKKRVEKILGLDKKEKFLHYYRIPDEYINITKNIKNLFEKFDDLNQGYIFFQGKAGSGKTTFITKFLSKLHEKDDIAVLRYYLFHYDDATNEDQSERIKKNYFYYDLSLQIKKYLDSDFNGEEYLNSSENNFKTFWDNLNILKQKYKKILVIIDGIDHAIRANKNNIITFFDGLKKPNEIPENIIFILSGQANWDNYPSWLKEQENKYLKKLEIQPFDFELSQEFIKNKKYWSDDNLIDFITNKSFEVTKGYPLNLRLFIEDIKNIKSKEEIENICDNRDFDDLNIYYGSLFEDIEEQFKNPQELEKFKALLFLLKEPLSAEVVESIFPDIDTFKFYEIISKILPILIEVKSDEYQLFHNDIRVYLSNQINSNIKEATLKKIISFYLKENRRDSSQKYLVKYLYETKQFDEIKKILNFDRLNLKYELLRNSNEIENEFQVGLKVAKETEDFIFMIQITLIHHQHYQVIENLGQDISQFNIKDEKIDLYTFVPPKKDDFSFLAMEKREKFFNLLLNENSYSMEDKKYFFNKFNFSVKKFLQFENLEKSKRKKIAPKISIFEEYFQVLLTIDKKEAFKIAQQNAENIGFSFSEAFHKAFGLTFKDIEVLKKNNFKISDKLIKKAIEYFYQENKYEELPELFLILFDNKEHYTNRTLYLAIQTNNEDLLPQNFEIKQKEIPYFDSTYRKDFEKGFLITFKNKLTQLNQTITASEKQLYFTKQISRWLGFLYAKENIYLSDLTLFLSHITSYKNDIEFNPLTPFFRKIIEKLNNELKNYIFEMLSKIEDSFSKNSDNFLFEFYLLAEKYNFKNYSILKLENNLKAKIQKPFYTTDKVERVETLIKIRKLQNKDFNDYLYLKRKVALNYGFRKDYQTDNFLSYFGTLLEKDYKKYRTNIFDFLYLEQFKQNGYSENTTSLESVVTDILKVVYKNSKTDLFIILNYFFQDVELTDDKRLKFSSELFFYILPNEVKSKEEAVLTYSFLKLGNIANIQHLNKSNIDKIEKLKSELQKFGLDFINILKGNLKEEKKETLSKEQELQKIEKEIIEKNIHIIFYSHHKAINKYPKEYYSILMNKFQICLEYDRLQHGILFNNLLELAPYVLDEEQINKTNKLVFTYLENLYENNSEELEKIENTTNNFEIIDLLKFLKKPFYCRDAMTMSSAIQSYIKIGEIFVDEVIDFILNEIKNINLFHYKIWLDILIELPLNKYKQFDKLKSDLISNYKKSEYIYLDSSFLKIFDILKITSQKNKQIFHLDVLRKPIILNEASKKRHYKDTFITQDREILNSFLNKFEKITQLDKKFLSDKIEFFIQNTNLETTSFYKNCYNEIAFLDKNLSFILGEFIQWLYQEKHIDKEQYKYKYLLQIIEVYDLRVLKQEKNKPEYILSMPEINTYTTENIDIQEYLNNLKLDSVISNSNKIFSGYWEQLLGTNYSLSNYVVIIEFNTFIFNQNEEIQDRKFLEFIYQSFGIDSFYLNQKNKFFQSFHKVFHRFLNKFIASTKQHQSSIIPNSNLFQFAPQNLDLNFIRWQYGDIIDNNSKLKYQGFGQIYELKTELKLKESEKKNQFLKIKILDKTSDNTWEKVFIL